MISRWRNARPGIRSLPQTLSLRDTAAVRARQRHFYDEECDPEFEITRPHGCGRAYEFLLEHKFQTGLGLLGCNLAGLSVIEVCCGSGMMSERFARDGAQVTGVDISSAAIDRARERARRYRFPARFMVGDAENLEFRDRCFDIAAVHDGLHHLQSPERAIREMARVARRAVLIMDPARSPLTSLAVLLGIAVKVEPAGNEVKRLAPRLVAALLDQSGCSRSVWRRTLMYYPHGPFGWFSWFNSYSMFLLYRVLFAGSNLLFSRWGNKLTLVAFKND